MKAVQRPREAIGLKPLYATTELARALGISRHRMMRLLEVYGVVVYRVGRSHFVPVSEIQERLAPLWASLREHTETRDVAD
jgi:hypothetical protein